MNTLKNEFPKISKVQLSMASNRAYGVVLSASAVRVLRKYYPDYKIDCRCHFVSLTRSCDERKTARRFSARVNDELYSKMAAEMSERGVTSVQEFIQKILAERYAD